MQVGETQQLVDHNRAFGFRGSNSTSGRAVQANPTSKIFHKRKTNLLYSTFQIMSRTQTENEMVAFLASNIGGG